MENPELRQEGKMELISITSELMPKGEPDLIGVVRYPQIVRLCQEVGKKGVFYMILTLVKDMCSSLNVVRNMNEDQMMEAASMLLDEAGNFRLEDYVMMFSMAKRGQLIKIYDRIDIDVVGLIADEYWIRRGKAGKKKQESEYNYFEDNLKEIERAPGKIPLGELEMLTTQMSVEAIEAAENLKNLTKKMAGKDPEQKQKNNEEIDARIKAQQEFFKKNLTPEQIQEIEQRRREIEVASSIYENEMKAK